MLVHRMVAAVSCVALALLSTASPAPPAHRPLDGDSMNELADEVMSSLEEAARIVNTKHSGTLVEIPETFMRSPE
ncbi:MAG: hypothetical protein M1829_001472 [Trizodia sp. TS-e1964]|nr:MAG: hypothetical protein M1829_001472 [Trizodia sp. TS-e1964]